MSIKIEPSQIPIAKFLAMERIILELVEDNKKLKRYCADHGVQIRDLYVSSTNTVSKAEFLAAIAAQKYYTNRSEQNRVRDRSSGEHNTATIQRERHYVRSQHHYERPTTGHSRPNTGIERPNTGNISIKEEYSIPSGPYIPSKPNKVNNNNDRPQTGNERPTTGNINNKDDTQNFRPNTGNSSVKDDIQNFSVKAMTSMTDKTIPSEDIDRILEENSKINATLQSKKKADSRLVEKADSYYALGISNKEDKLGKELAILTHLVREMELDADETYQKVEYLENQLTESRNEIEVLTVKLKRVEKNYMDLKKAIAADQQIILNRLDSLQSDHSQQKQYVSNIHSTMDKNFTTVKNSILRVSTRNNDTIKEAMAAAVKIAMMDDSFDLQEDSHEIRDTPSVGNLTSSFSSRNARRGSALYQSFSSEPSTSIVAPIVPVVEALEIETIESRPVMKDALYPELNLSKNNMDIEPNGADADVVVDDDNTIRYVNDGSDVSENPHMSILDVLKSKGVHLSKNFPNGTKMYESNENIDGEQIEALKLSENITFLTETNKRLCNYEAILSALTFRVDHSTDLVEKLHSAVRLLDSEHNGLLASHKELMRKTDRSEAVTMSILDQIIHACETCQAAVERQEGLSLEQARQFRIISDRIKKKGGGDDVKSGSGRITFTNAGYAAPTLPTLPNIKEWESMENSLTDQKIDPNTIMKQLDEYRRVYRSMVLEMNQIIHKKKEDHNHERSSSPPKHVNVIIPQTKSAPITNAQSNTTSNDNNDIKNILQRSDLSYNPTIMYLKDEIGNMKKSLSIIQNVKIKPVPKHTLVTDIEGGGPDTHSNNNKKKVIVPRPPSESKTSRGSCDFNLDDETAVQLLSADFDNQQQYINHNYNHHQYDHHQRAITTTNQKPVSRIKKYFEKYNKIDDRQDDNDDNNDQDTNTNTNDKRNKNQFCKGDWPNSNDNNNNILSNNYMNT